MVRDNVASEIERAGEGADLPVVLCRAAVFGTRRNVGKNVCID